MIFLPEFKVIVKRSPGFLYFIFMNENRSCFSMTTTIRAAVHLKKDLFLVTHTLYITKNCLGDPLNYLDRQPYTARTYPCVQDHCVLPLDLQDHQVLRQDHQDLQALPLDLQDHRVLPLDLQDHRVLPLDLQDHRVLPMDLQDHQVFPLDLQDHRVLPLDLQDNRFLPLDLQDHQVLPLDLQDPWFLPRDPQLNFSLGLCLFQTYLHGVST